MKKLNICIIDLIYNAPTSAIYPRLMYANYVSIMPQVIGVWCKQEGHHVKYLWYAGIQNLATHLPTQCDLVFISSFTFTAHLAYALSNLFKNRGSVTVLGGSHARSYPEDACKYFDYVLGLTDKNLIRNLLNDFVKNSPRGIYLSAKHNPTHLPGVRERWEFIEMVFKKAPFVKVVPLISSFGCPYNCDFCIDSTVSYKTLDTDDIKEDLRFLVKKMRNPRVGWYDPTFGVKFNDILNAIEDAVPPGRIDFAAETNLAVLSEQNVKRLKYNGFKVIMPGIESWYEYGKKSGTGNKVGKDKVVQVAEQMNMIQRYIPYVQANFILGSDSDKGKEPFELLKLFTDLSPGTYPSYSLLIAFGQSTAQSNELARDHRVIPFPFHFLYTEHTLNINPLNYTWKDFYDHLIDLHQYSFSKRALVRRFKKVNLAVPRLASLAQSLSIGRNGKLKYHTFIRNKLLTNHHFRDFFDQETDIIPDYFINKIYKDLGPFSKWLPEEALYHDPNVSISAKESI